MLGMGNENKKKIKIDKNKREEMYFYDRQKNWKSGIVFQNSRAAILESFVNPTAKTNILVCRIAFVNSTTNSNR